MKTVHPSVKILGQNGLFPGNTTCTVGTFSYVPNSLCRKNLTFFIQLLKIIKKFWTRPERLKIIQTSCRIDLTTKFLSRSVKIMRYSVVRFFPAQRIRDITKCTDCTWHRNIMRQKFVSTVKLVPSTLTRANLNLNSRDFCAAGEFLFDRNEIMNLLI